jgi:hypothetical protein
LAVVWASACVSSTTALEFPDKLLGKWLATFFGEEDGLDSHASSADVDSSKALGHSEALHAVSDLPDAAPIGRARPAPPALEEEQPSYLLASMPPRLRMEEAYQVRRCPGDTLDVE